MKLFDDSKDLIHDDGRQAHGGLIQHHELGMGHQGPGHGKHLLLAAGEGPGDLLPALLQPGEVVKDHLQVLLRYGFFDIRTHFQVFLYGHFQENTASFRHMGKARP